MAEQQDLALPESVSAFWAAQGKRLLAVVREEVQANCAKQGDGLAADLGADPSHLSQALRGNGKHLPVSWLPGIIHACDRNLRIVRAVAALKGCEARPRECSDREYRQRMEEALKRAGALGVALRKDAFGGEELP